MMTSSNGNIFRVTGHLYGEFTGSRWIPAQRPVTRSFDVYFDLRLNKRLSKQSWGWWFETLPRPLRRHSNINGCRASQVNWFYTRKSSSSLGVELESIPERYYCSWSLLLFSFMAHQGVIVYQYEKKHHCSSVTEALWRLKPPATRMFVRHWAMANKNKIIEAPQYWAFCKVNSHVTVWFPQQRASNEEIVSMPWLPLYVTIHCDPGIPFCFAKHLPNLPLIIVVFPGNPDIKIRKIRK